MAILQPGDVVGEGKDKQRQAGVNSQQQAIHILDSDLIHLTRERMSNRSSKVVWIPVGSRSGLLGFHHER